MEVRKSPWYTVIILNCESEGVFPAERIFQHKQSVKDEGTIATEENSR